MGDNFENNELFGDSGGGGGDGGPFGDSGSGFDGGDGGYGSGEPLDPLGDASPEVFDIGFKITDEVTGVDPTPSVVSFGGQFEPLIHDNNPNPQPQPGQVSPFSPSSIGNFLKGMFGGGGSGGAGPKSKKPFAIPVKHALDSGSLVTLALIAVAALLAYKLVQKG